MNKETKIKCHLTTRGTEKANAKVVDDLTVPDPEIDVGEQMIAKAMENGVDNDGKSTNPK